MVMSIYVSCDGIRVVCSCVSCAGVRVDVIYVPCVGIRVVSCDTAGGYLCIAC